ncbi:MAG TPA: WD40 repeat domain-containing protein [Abditibacteriaceae bacterium]|jgi:WD40 repeat protein
MVLSGSNDGRRLFVSSWNPRSGALLHQAFAIINTDYEVPVAVSQRGDLMVSGGFNRTLQIRSVRSGKIVRKLEERKELNTAARSVAFSPDGEIVVGSFDANLQLWSTRTGKWIKSLSSQGETILCVAFAAKGSLIAAGDLANTIRIWDAQSGKLLHTLHDSFRVQRQGSHGVITLTGINAVAFSVDGKLLASGGVDRVVRVWRLGSNGPIHRFTGHQNDVGALSFSPDGRKLASGSDDKRIKLWAVQKVNNSRK